MPRRARTVAKGLPHHIVQRGNYKQNVFESFQDFRQYCYFIKQYQDEYPVEIISYCLMNNHVHFIMVPQSEDGLGEFFRTVHMRYSQYKNTKEKRKGHLWQGRYFSSILDQAYLHMAIRYVERNPVRAKLVDRAWEYSWSSARERVGVKDIAIIEIKKNIESLGLYQGINQWMKYLEEPNLVEEKQIRESTERGYVFGREEFIVKIEQELGVSLKQKLPGRPRK